MPVSCVECPCAYYTEGMHHDCCQATREDNDITAFEESRPDWCPLLELPDPGAVYAGHGSLLIAEDDKITILTEEVGQA